jgi:hypothetical protein
MATPRRAEPVEPQIDEHLPEVVSEGKSEATPFVLIGGVATVVLTVVVLLTVVCLIIWWLV